jgi:hypothetical protein
MKKVSINTVVLVSLFVFLALSVAGQGDTNPGPALIRKQLADLHRSFTYKGKLIHPRAIKDLVSWVADPLPGPVVVDVAGTFETNRYFGEYKTQENGLVSIDLAQQMIEEKGSFSYRHLGRLANGYHVLHVYDWGGGSGIFECILLVEARIDYEYFDGGRRRNQLLLRRRGQFGIGDRYEGVIKVDSKRNLIIVGPDKRNLPRAYRIWIR